MTREDADDPYHSAGGPRLYGLPILPDAAHFNKSLDSNAFLNKLWLDDWLCGAFQLFSRFWDADCGRREAVRSVLTRELLRRKNAFSVEAAVARRDRPLLAVMLSKAERTTKEALMISTLGPARDRQWRENTPNMYGKPLGVAYHMHSNLLFYVDAELKQLRVLKLSHTPCDNAAVTSAASQRTLSQLRDPVCVSLIDNHAYITDRHTEHAALYVIDVSHICKSFGAGEREAASGSSSKVVRVGLRGVRIRQPYGLVARPDASELFVGCQTSWFVMRITLGTPTDGVAETLCRLPAAPTGIDVLTSTGQLVVAAGEAIHLVDLVSGSRQQILCVAGASFVGICKAPAALGHALYAIDYNNNSVCRLHFRGAEHSTSNGGFEQSAIILAGGNPERPCSGRDAIWYEGTAKLTELWRPTFGAFARNAFVFMNSGRGDFGKVLVLNDLYPMAMRLMPAMVEAADAFGLTKDHSHHAPDRLTAAMKLEPLTAILQEIEDCNAKYRESSRGLEGPMGNFSRIVRHSCHQLGTILLQQVGHAALLGAPQSCLSALSATSVTTLDVEYFFRGQRAQWPNPYAAQYSQSHSLAMMIEAARRGDAPFSFWTSNATPPSHSGRAHYHGSGVKSIAERIYEPKRGKPKRMNSKKRRQRLEVLHRLAALFKQARQQRVTDKAKEKVGTQPAPFYGPTSVTLAAMEAEDARVNSISSEDARVNSISSQIAQDLNGSVAPVYRSGDLVFVRPFRGALWVAQLTEPVVEIAPGRFNVDRPKCRYFVRTDELAGYEHAMIWWQQRGQGLRLADEAAALARAAASAAVHFSFEKTDHVTRSTICGRFAPSSIIEELSWHSELVSFAVSEIALTSAREVVSAGPHEREATSTTEDAVLASEAQVAETAARAAAAAMAVDDHARKLAEKREQGKKRQELQKLERDQKRAHRVL
jgi:hypothetical protein